ncbi:sulfotransferase family protein [Gymnodinialimonas ceratoperidinii]|uniref:Sulfotransferase domain-containing protein n=1 Tax=Gymnodinialimonas ceratoperidinii TaxID=2856823 RepID=A0A8F6TWH2_9RHOB|nr:sulfotransferase [Gymnodinialimonas ceratoperidinii]QXT39454.1 sulfotransferase domain-containing protein [Gymnodinialimonas ceratoperidinii]
MKPQFVFIGPHKSGTTWIDNYLRSRDDVLLPALTKETFFFDKQYHKGMDWYESQFGDMSDNHRICVEVAPSLLDKPEAAQRLAQDLPDITVIATLRDPIERAIAHYFHHLKGGEPDNGFRYMAEKHPELISNGLYYRHLKMWVDLMGEDRVKILLYNDLNVDPMGYCKQICDILGLPFEPPSEDVLYARINEDGDPPFRFLAKLARRTAENLRFVGAHRIVNAIRTPTVRRMIYGAPPEAEKRTRLREEAQEFYDEFFQDFRHLDTEFGVDTSAWRG